jgi:hypothetical protein
MQCGKTIVRVTVLEVYARPSRSCVGRWFLWVVLSSWSVTPPGTTSLFAPRPLCCERPRRHFHHTSTAQAYNPPISRSPFGVCVPSPHTPPSSQLLARAQWGVPRHPNRLRRSRSVPRPKPRHERRMRSVQRKQGYVTTPTPSVCVHPPFRLCARTPPAPAPSPPPRPKFSGELPLCTGLVGVNTSMH